MRCPKVQFISFRALSIEVQFTPEFKRNLRALSKKYRNIRLDIQPVLEQIMKGNFVGDKIPQTGEYIILKVRVRNRDIRKGKSAGYRLIYYVKTEKNSILITIYSKTEKSNITPDQIRRILKKYENVD